MNERIEKMMLEATKDIPQGYYVPPQYFEKFAELIVKECANKVDSNLRDWLQDSNGTMGDKIKEHFGVEE